MEKTFAFIGSWSMAKEPGPLGIAAAAYDPETGEMEVLRRCFPQIKAGAFFLDETRDVLYCVDERPEVPGKTLGGQVFGLKLRPETGELEELTVSPSFGPLPSDCAVDETGRYLIVSNHSGRNAITKTVQDALGKYHLVREYDETAVVLFPLDSQGRIGEPLDIVRHMGQGVLPNQQSSHAHCVRRAPEGNLFIVCDKGSDSMYAYRIDTEQNKLVCCDLIDCLPGSSPRYCVFHPTKPLLYYNCETRPVVGVVRYNRYGKLTPVAMVDCMDSGEPETKGMQSDIRISADGKNLYTLVRDNSTIVVYSLDDETGLPTRVQTVPCGTSRGGRWMTLSPDGRYLFLAACPDDRVCRFRVTENGTLLPPEEAAEGPSPSAIVFYTPDSMTDDR